jgi:hypothetical protein
LRLGLSEAALVRTQKVLQKLTEEVSLPFWVPVEFSGLSWSIFSALEKNPNYLKKKAMYYYREIYLISLSNTFVVINITRYHVD